MSKWLTIHADHIKLCLKREKKRAKNCLQDLLCWMVKLTKKSVTPTNANKMNKLPTKKQQTLTSLFQASRAPSEMTSKTMKPANTTKNLKCSSVPRPSHYIQTMLKLRQVKKINCLPTGNPEESKLSTTGNEAPTQETPVVT